MSYCGLDLVCALGATKTCVQVILVTATSRTEVWVQDGQITQVVGSPLEELLSRLTEDTPVVMMNPVAPVSEDKANSKISVASLEVARLHDLQKKEQESTPKPVRPSGATISNRIKPAGPAPQDLKKARPILFRPGEPLSITIGRGHECNMVTEDHKASRKHCRVTYQQDNFFVQDLSSTNGTYLNGERVHAVKARAGDILMIGDDRFILMSEKGF
jgi:predicted DNA-binding protein (UPF0251 family)